MRRVKRKIINQVCDKYTVGALVKDSMIGKRVELPNIWIFNSGKENISIGEDACFYKPVLTDVDFNTAKVLFSSGKGLLNINKGKEPFILKTIWEHDSLYNNKLEDKQYKCLMDSIAISSKYEISEEMIANIAISKGALEHNGSPIIYGPVYFSPTDVESDGTIVNYLEGQCWFTYEKVTINTDENEKDSDEDSSEEKTVYDLIPHPYQFVKYSSTRLFASYYPEYDKFFFTNEVAGEWIVLDYSLPTTGRRNKCCFAVLAKRIIEYPGEKVSEEVIPITNWLQYNDGTFYFYGIKSEPHTNDFLGTSLQQSFYTVINNNSNIELKINESTIEIVGNGDGTWKIKEDEKGSFEPSVDNKNGCYWGQLKEDFVQNKMRAQKVRVDVHDYGEVTASSPLSKYNEKLRKDQYVILSKRGDEWIIISAEC